jgi:hypothetical protein
VLRQDGLALFAWADCGSTQLRRDNKWRAPDIPTRRRNGFCWRGCGRRRKEFETETFPLGSFLAPDCKHTVKVVIALERKIIFYRVELT